MDEAVVQTGIPAVKQWSPPDVAWQEQTAVEVFGDAVIPHLPETDSAIKAGDFVRLLLEAMQDSSSGVLTPDDSQWAFENVVFPWLKRNPEKVPNDMSFEHDWQDFPLAALELDPDVVDAVEDMGIHAVGSLADYVDIYTPLDGQMFGPLSGEDFVAYAKAAISAMFVGRGSWVAPPWVPLQDAEPIAEPEIDDPAEPIVTDAPQEAFENLPTQEWIMENTVVVRVQNMTDHEKLLKINEAAQEAEAANARHQAAKETAAALKKEAEAADARLRRVIAEVNEPEKPMPLFDKKPASDPPVASQSPAVADQAAPASSKPDVSAIPIEKLTDNPSVVSYLQDAGFDTVGKFFDYQRAKGEFWDKDLKVADRRKPRNFRQIIDDASLLFWANADAQQAS